MCLPKTCFLHDFQLAQYGGGVNRCCLNRWTLLIPNWETMPLEQWHSVFNSETHSSILSTFTRKLFFYFQFIGSLDRIVLLQNWTIVSPLKKKHWRPSLVKKWFTWLQTDFGKSFVSHYKHTASWSVCLSLSSLPDGWWRKCSHWCARLEKPCLDLLLNTSFTQLCATLVLPGEPTDSFCCRRCLQPFLPQSSQTPQQAWLWLELHSGTVQLS